MPATSPTISFELYPPRTPKGAAALPATVAALASVKPDFFSVTYGASGRTRETSGALLAHIIEHTDVAPIAHLTCVGASEADLEEVVTGLIAIGVRDFLALRGDPPEGEPDWRPHPEGFTTASELVTLLRRVEARELAGSADTASPLSIAVAAYPGGRFDEHGNPVVEPGTVEALRAKQDAGADYAITQVFFDPASYAGFVRTAREAGVHIPIVPGIIPLTDPRRLRKLESLTGVPVPESLLQHLESAPDPEERYRRGLAAGVDLVQGVLEAGAPGLHIYTFNSRGPALDLLAAAGLRSAPVESR
ncbi:methylenetetrahydrofolate reductase [Pseudactinotalea suaedae]|uniref:methylenetetrahydrofolate reductase n=1 Tax=Pseudactinotalea suaedae TaxID=1524924 RepID=UPI001F4F92CF|nr:methylenetetrahydrofolate reductase [Pseudactinotalea suaedae]